MQFAGPLASFLPFDVETGCPGSSNFVAVPGSRPGPVLAMCGIIGNTMFEVSVMHAAADPVES